jgi:hypothetical protein
MDSSLAGAVTFDGKKTGKVMPGEYQALLVGDKVRPLPHPLERSGLRAENQTYLSASLSGLFLQVERRICLQCGYIFDSPHLAFAGVAGCLPALLVALAGFAVLRFAAHITTGKSLFAAWALMVGLAVLFYLAGALYIRVRFSKRQASIAQPLCPACQGSRSVSVSRAAGKRVQIGGEDNWIQVSIAGKS